MTAPDHPPMLEITLEAVKGRLKGCQMLVRPYPVIKKSKGGIDLPDTASIKPPMAWIVDMSKDAKEQNPDLDIGDTIILAGNSALPLFTLGDPPNTTTYSIVSADPNDAPLSMKGQS